MSGGGNAPVIIKRKKVVSGGGHHGGAWKVAYADFVTAMMAFFMLMWLLNATTEKQRKGLADYFNPTIPINRVSGGGDGALGGDSVFTEQTLAQNGIGATDRYAAERQEAGAGLRDRADEATLRELEEMLTGTGGESMATENQRRHIVTRVTDEGLVVELFALEGSPLFTPGTDRPTPLLEDLVAVVGRVFALARNPVAVEGHSRSHAVVLAENPVWTRSLARAQRAKALLADAIAGERIDRVAGHADRQPAVANPMSVRNDRLELILLRSDI
jgi:chemotaxis protein MotB